MVVALLKLNLEAPPSDAPAGLTCPECGCADCQVSDDGASCPECQAQWVPELNQVVVPESQARRAIFAVLESREQRRLQEAKDELL